MDEHVRNEEACVTGDRAHGNQLLTKRGKRNQMVRGERESKVR